MGKLLSAFGGVVLACSSVLCGDSLNMLKNPGFEEDMKAWQVHRHGDAVGMRVNASQTDGKGVGSGVHCGYIKKPLKSSRFVALWQDVPVKAGERYLLAGTIRGKGRLFFYNYGPKGTWMGANSGLKTNCAEWIGVSKEVVIKKGVVRVQVRYEMYGEENEGEGWVDDVYFGPVPPMPGQVRGLAVKALPDGSKEVSWQAVTMPGVSYRIFRSRYPDTGAEHVQSVAETKDLRWIDREVPGDWAYCYYQVTAVGDYRVQGKPSAQVQWERKGTKVSRPLVWTASSMEKYRRYQAFPTAASGEVDRSVRLQLARNEAESCQIVVGAGSAGIRKLEASFDGFRGMGDRLKGALYRVHYSRVKRPTVNSDLVRPGLLADALPPWQGSIAVPPHALQSIWFQVVSGADCPPGTYDGTVTVRGDGKVLARVRVSAEVWNFTVPVTPSFQTAFAVWPRFIELAFGVKPNSPESRRLYEKCYWFMADRRMLPGRLPVSLTSPEADRFLKDPRVNGFCLPVGWETVNEKALRSMADHLRKQGLLGKGFIYCIDEPTPAQYPKCKALADQVHKVGKDIRFLLTEEPVKELKGAVDIWVPILGRFDPVECEKYRAQGNNIWWYTCVGPQAPYPTYLIDDIGASHRVLSWLQAKYRIEGVLYWCVNVCSRYENGAYQKDVVVWDECEVFPNANGDGFLLYPGKQVGIDGPVSSIRLEILRDGNEDVEYLTLLRQLLTKKGCKDVEGEIGKLIAPVATDLRHWTKDFRVMEEQRRAVARRILAEQ